MTSKRCLFVGVARRTSLTAMIVTVAASPRSRHLGRHLPLIIMTTTTAGAVNTLTISWATEVIASSWPAMQPRRRHTVSLTLHGYVAWGDEGAKYGKYSMRLHTQVSVTCRTAQSYIVPFLSHIQCNMIYSNLGVLHKGIFMTRQIP